MQTGWSQRQIAEALGVREGTVSQWMTRASQGGPEALGAAPRREHRGGCPPNSWRVCATCCAIDESGFHPLPSVVRTYAPVGQTPIPREWWTRDHLSAISAISPEGKRYFHSQDRAINSDDVVGFLEHLRRQVPGQMVPSGMGRRSTALTPSGSFSRSGRRHASIERQPAYAPELNPGESLWPQLTGIELRHVCCFDVPHLCGELRAAVKRVRRTPRMHRGSFQGAGL